MSVPPSAIDRAVTVATRLEAQGFFEEVRKGDQKAASLFARLVAWDLNPSGDEEDFGCLSKSPGETQVDGFAEDAIVYGNDPANRLNVIDLVNGAGAPNATINDRPEPKPRREHNRWVKPQPLTTSQLLYLRPSGKPPDPPTPVRRFPGYEEIGGDSFYRAFVGVPLTADYIMAGETFNDGMAVWYSRTIFSMIEAFWQANGQPIDPPGIVRKYRNEWRAELRRAHPDTAHLLPPV